MPVICVQYNFTVDRYLRYNRTEKFCTAWESSSTTGYDIMLIEWKNSDGGVLIYSYFNIGHKICNIKIKKKSTKTHLRCSWTLSSPFDSSELTVGGESAMWKTFGSSGKVLVLLSTAIIVAIWYIIIIMYRRSLWT